jgi:hypothetical protein
MRTIKNTTTILSLLIVSVSYGQNENSSSGLSKVETTSTGVTVYESKGVESKISINGNNPNHIPKLISDWTMEECYNGLFGVNDKIYYLENNKGDESEIKRYKNIKKEIIDRQEFLRTQIGK